MPLTTLTTLKCGTKGLDRTKHVLKRSTIEKTTAIFGVSFSSAFLLANPFTLLFPSFFARMYGGAG